VREGNGPYILEVQTYRYRGHSMSDPAKYRSKEELENYKLNDPLEIASQEIIKKKIASKKDLENINKKIIKEIKDAADYALDSPFPADEDLYTNVYL
jgi:pyruvate dehydrogenase E1 component alpha subunit